MSRVVPIRPEHERAVQAALGTGRLRNSQEAARWRLTLASAGADVDVQQLLTQLATLDPARPAADIGTPVAASSGRVVVGPAVGRVAATAAGLRVTPAVAAAAKAHGINLHAVTGTGIGGRITVDDVKRMSAVAAGLRSPLASSQPSSAPVHEFDQLFQPTTHEEFDRLYPQERRAVSDEGFDQMYPTE